MMMKVLKLQLLVLLSISVVFVEANGATDTFTPFRSEDEVPKTVTELWKDYDARKESLDTEVIKTWKEEGVVINYVLFNVCTVKGVTSKIAAYYTYPEGMKKGPAFVRCHGGGGKPQRDLGVYFAKQGYATVDINWGGSAFEEGIEVNTDWGAVEPTQGEMFYPKAKRRWKRNLLPDEYTIDPVISPRNQNWFPLAVAGRRAITFLEQQLQVDPEKIGFTGYSMGGHLTSLVSIDPRLKAVAPFVGGAGYKYLPLPGIPGSFFANNFKEHLDLYINTMDSSRYWPIVKCPVLAVTSSNDFSTNIDCLFRSIHLLPHSNWRVSLNLHGSHSPGPAQWIVLNMWFDEYLKGIPQNIPNSTSRLVISEDKTQARFEVSPEQPKRIQSLHVFYTYDTKYLNRFWKHIPANQVNGKWFVPSIEIRSALPIHVFANITYKLDKVMESHRGETSTYTISSDQHIYMPEKIEYSRLKERAAFKPVLDDFSMGSVNWSPTRGGGFMTYILNDPDLLIPEDKSLAIKVDSTATKITGHFVFMLGKDTPRPDRCSYSASTDGKGEIIIKPQDVNMGESEAVFSWSNVAKFMFTISGDGKHLNIADCVEMISWK